MVAPMDGGGGKEGDPWAACGFCLPTLDCDDVVVGRRNRRIASHVTGGVSDHGRWLGICWKTRIAGAKKGAGNLLVQSSVRNAYSYRMGRACRHPSFVLIANEKLYFSEEIPRHTGNM
jgi:hypothetical protein